MTAGSELHVDYEMLEDILRQVRSLEDRATEMRQLLLQHNDEVVGGAWEGQGAKNYHQEYNEVIEPALKRLIDAMVEAQTTVKAIKGETLDLEQALLAIWRKLLAMVPEGFGGAAGSSPSLVDEILAAYNDSAFLKVTSTGLGTYGFLSDIAEHADDFPSKIGQYLGNPNIKFTGKALGFAGAGISLGNFINDPDVVSGMDFGASAIGLSGHPVAGAFSFGWGVGSLARPITTPYWSEKLAEWDPLGVGYNPRDYPNTFINDYESSGDTMPMDVAQDVYRGLQDQNSDKAWDFARKYSQSQDMSPMEFHMQSSWGVW